MSNTPRDQEETVPKGPKWLKHLLRRCFGVLLRLKYLLRRSLDGVASFCFGTHSHLRIRRQSSSLAKAGKYLCLWFSLVFVGSWLCLFALRVICLLAICGPLAFWFESLRCVLVSAILDDFDS